MIISMIIWGMSWSSAKVLAQFGSALSIAYLRFWIVVLALTPILFSTKTDFKIHKKGIKYAIGAGVFLGSYSLLFFTGLQKGFAGAGGVLVTTINPVFVFILGAIISRKLPNKFEVIGLLMGLSGGMILLKVWGNLDNIIMSGNFIFLIAAFTWAMMTVISSYGNRYGNPFSFILWIHVTVVVLMSFAVDFKEVKSLLLSEHPHFWGNLLYIGIINSTLATVCYMYGASQLGAKKTSTFMFLVPVSALLGAAFFLGEAIQLHTVIGGTLAILAIFVINRQKKAKKITPIEKS